MNRWVKWGLWAIAGLGGVWLASKAFTRTVVEPGEDVPVPLFTPSIAPGAVQGVSEFPSAVNEGAGINLLELLKFERQAEIEDRDFASQQAREARQASQQASQTAKDTNFLRKAWERVNKGRIGVPGKNPYKVCILPNGTIGIRDQCKGVKSITPGTAPN